MHHGFMASMLSMRRAKRGCRRGRRGDQGGGRSTVDRRERVGVDDGDVLGDADSRPARPRRGRQCCGVELARCGRVSAARQAAVERERAVAVVGVEVGVAAAHRQSVGLTDGRQHLDRAPGG